MSMCPCGSLVLRSVNIERCMKVAIDSLQYDFDANYVIYKSFKELEATPPSLVLIGIEVMPPVTIIVHHPKNV